MAAPKIRVDFEVDGRQFKAVSFLNEGESPVDGDEMLRRVPEAIGEEDAKFLDDRSDQDWSQELSFPYYLATGWENPEDSHVLCFYRDNDGWYDFWRWLGSDWYDDCLVVCHRT